MWCQKSAEDNPHAESELQPRLSASRDAPGCFFVHHSLTPADPVVVILRFPAGRSAGSHAEVVGRLIAPYGVSISGGAPVTLGAAGSPYGASWGADDTIVFGNDSPNGLWSVPADGGEPSELTAPKGPRLNHAWPGLCQVDVARTGFASDQTATQTFGLGTGHLTPNPEGTCAQEAMVDGSQQVAAGAKEILHESVYR